MTQFVHLLTAAAILVHATMGCCAHESHDTESHDTSETCCEQSSSCDSEHDDHEHANHSTISHSKNSLPPKEASSVQGLSCTAGYQSQQPEPHECSHAGCSLSAPEVRSCADLMLLNFAGTIQWTATAPPVFFLNIGIDSPHLLPDFSLHTVPLRTHLAKSVLLI